MIFGVSDILYYLISIPLTIWLCRLLSPSLLAAQPDSARVPEVDAPLKTRVETSRKSPAKETFESKSTSAGEQEEEDGTRGDKVREGVRAPETTAELQAAGESVMSVGGPPIVSDDVPKTAEVGVIAAAAAAARVDVAAAGSSRSTVEHTSPAGTLPQAVDGGQSTTANSAEQEKRVGAHDRGEDGEPPGFETHRPVWSGGVHLRQQDTAGGYQNHRQPTANEFEIQRTILTAANSRSVNGLLAIVDMHVNQLNSVNVSTLIHRLASITQNQEQSQKALTRDPRMKRVLRRAVELAPTSSCQSLSNISWAVGKLQMVEEKEVMQAIVEAAKTRLDHFRPQNFSNMLYGLSRVGYCDKALMELVSKKVAGTLCTFKPQEVSNLLYAYGRLNCFNEQLLQEISACVSAMMPRYDGHGVGNIMCSLARLNYPSKELLDAVAADVVYTPHKYGKFLIAKILRPMHSLGYTNLSMLMTTSKYILDHVGAIRVDEMAIVMQGFAQEGIRAPPSDSEEDTLSASVRRPSPSIGLLEYEAASYRVDALMQAAALKLSTVAKLEEVSLEKIVQLFNLMARLGMKARPSNGGFLLSACARILQNLDTLGAEQIKSILQSCAMMELALTSFEERLLSEIADPDDTFVIGAASSTAAGTASCSSPQSLVGAPAASESMPVDLLPPGSGHGLPWNSESLKFLLETDEHFAQQQLGDGGKHW
ncbi:hypothetical protein FOZ61_000391 [Perkinsus olseni]|uniref:Uncharacterized protein n=1 Tax=Perkinsus olseni TaxID=32597 RepID=A0A7J6KTF5_PEROL|nr:hypothetical protein FOZ61_000391 [Perkinsus olseni]KAF4651378.1 hypothetical protein FOL46_000351 [Perkinsus olseni]